MNKRNKKKWLPKNVFMLGFVSFFTDLSTEMIYPLLPLFLSTTLGASRGMIGLIEGIAETTASILKVFSGYISDKIKKRKFLVFLGYTLSTITKPFFSIATRAWHVLFVRFLDRVGKGIRTSPRDALIADSINENIRGRAFGFHRAMDTLGAVFGPLTAFLLLPLVNNNYRTIFLISFIPGVIAVSVVLFFVKERITSKSKAQKVKIIFKNLTPEFKLFVILSAIFTLGNSSGAFLILRAITVDISPKMIPILWLIFNVVYTIAATPSGILSDKIGRKPVIIIGFMIYTLVYVGFAFANAAFQVWILFIIYGIYYGIIEVNFRAYVADLVPSNIRATAYGVFHTTVGITAFPASVIMGVLWDSVGVKFAFLFGAALALISGTGLIFLKTKKMR